MDMTDARVEEYITGLLKTHDEPVLLEMEAEANERGFPIVGRMVGVVIELLARGIGAKRVFELGSGFGYSGYWFSRAIGSGGELHLTDGDEANRDKAADYLGRAGLDGPVSFTVGDALTAFNATEGEFDIVFCDIDKWQYPEAWETARERIRRGGLWICDNTIQAGGMNVVSDADTSGASEAVRRHNREVVDDERFLATILPIRDGVMVALRTT